MPRRPNVPTPLAWLAHVTTLVALAACSSTPTQALLHFDADPSLAANATRLTLRVSGPDGEPELREIDLREHSLPITFPIVPRDGDATREYDVHAELFADAVSIGEQRAHGAYVAGALVELQVHFDVLCRDVRCPEGEGEGEGEASTCAQGYCIDDCHPVSTEQPSSPGGCFEPCALTTREPLVIDVANTTLRNVRVLAPAGEPGIVITADNVTLEHVEVITNGGNGIEVRGNGAYIHMARVINEGDPEAEGSGIYVDAVTDTRIERVQFERVAKGVNASGAAGLAIRWANAVDLKVNGRGLFNCANCVDVTLEDFSTVNTLDEGARGVWLEDTTDVSLRRGLVDGTPSQSAGCYAVRFAEPGPDDAPVESNVLFEDLDAVRGFHTAFAATRVNGMRLVRTRCRDRHEAGEGGGHCWFLSGVGCEVVSGEYDAWPDAGGNHGGCVDDNGTAAPRVDVEEVPGLVVRAPFEVPLCF